MGNLIEADTKQIAKAAENMMKSVTEIKNELSALAESMKAMDSKWDGVASIAFLNEFGKDCETLSEFCEFLERYCEDTRLAIQYYKSNEASINDTVFWLSV